MRSNYLNYTAPYTNMITQLNLLSDELDQVEIKGKKIYEEPSVLIDLKRELLNLTQNVNSMWLPDDDRKKILLQTYLTLTNPSIENCKKLQNLADNTLGCPDTWGKISAVLVVIVGLLLGVIPGLLMLSWAGARWHDSSRNGLSLDIHQVNTSIKHSGAPDKFKFFSNEPKASADAAVVEFAATNGCQ